MGSEETTMNYTVREARSDDLERLVEFILAEAHEAEGITMIEDVVRQGIKTGLENKAIASYWVAEDRDGEVVGNVSAVQEWSDWRAGFYWWIQSMFILPEHRGQGLTPLLLQAVKNAASQAHALELRLYVHTQNSRAIRAYHKSGFQDAPYTIMTTDI